jgi:hypothetical protein
MKVNFTNSTFLVINQILGFFEDFKGIKSRNQEKYCDD